MNQKTIAKEFTLSGPGLHTGNHTRVTFRPAPENTGIIFVRDDLKSQPRIHLNPDCVLGVIRGTTIGTKEAHIHTVEHILATLSALGIDNVFVHMTNSEPPALDGSSKPYVNAILQVGAVDQSAPKDYFQVTEKIEYSAGDTKITAEPSDDFEIDSTIIYNHPMITTQRYALKVTPERFAAEIAPARTFCFDYEIEALQNRGLGRGGDLSNTVIIGQDKFHAEGGLRFADEFIRHKILDLIGDLYLLGRPIKAKITAVKTGHLHNINFVKKLISGRKTSMEEKMPIEIKVGEPLGAAQIQKIIPHRYPFLMIDKVVVTEAGKKATGYKAVSGNEPFFQGHFPGNPIMPGVLIIEALAQTSCILFLSRPDLLDKIAYFMSIEKAKFRKPVEPGDYLELKIEVLKAKERFGKVKGEAFVNGNIVTEAEFTFALVDKNIKG